MYSYLSCREARRRNELGSRLALWEAGCMETFLLWLEQQQDEMARGLAAAGVGPRQAARARRPAREGAYRKSVVSVKGGMEQYSLEEQQEWARQLVTE